jgi:hypothetical protein
MAFKPCRAFNGRLANADYKISGGYRSAPDITELCWNLGDGVNQAADISWLATSIPSRNVTPPTTLGN